MLRKESVMENRRKYRVKSKARFTLFIVIIMLIASAGITTVLGINNVNGESQQKYINVQVIAGETLWDIADRYKSNDTDTREFVYDIQHENDLSTANLTVGETIKVPVQ